MSRKLPRVSPLILRKDLLIAESELNRAQFMEKWEAATEWRHALNDGARTFGSLASTAVLVMSGIQAFRRKLKPQDSEKRSWLQPVIKGVGLIASLCEAFRSRGAEPQGKTRSSSKD